MIPYKLEPLPIEQKKHTDLSHINGINNVSHFITPRPEQDNHDVSYRSIMKYGAYTSEQNLKSELFLDNEQNQKKLNNYNIYVNPLNTEKKSTNEKNIFKNYSSPHNINSQQGSDSPIKPENYYKVKIQGVRSVQNGSIFQIYSNNTNNSEKGNNIESHSKSDKDTLSKRKQTRLEDNRQNFATEDPEQNLEGVEYHIKTIDNIKSLEDLKTIENLKTTQHFKTAENLKTEDLQYDKNIEYKQQNGNQTENKCNGIVQYAQNNEQAQDIKQNINKENLFTQKEILFHQIHNSNMSNNNTNISNNFDSDQSNVQRSPKFVSFNNQNSLNNNNVSVNDTTNIATVNNINLNDLESEHNNNNKEVDNNNNKNTNQMKCLNMKQHTFMDVLDNQSNNNNNKADDLNDYKEKNIIENKNELNVLPSQRNEINLNSTLISASQAKEAKQFLITEKDQNEGQHNSDESNSTISSTGLNTASEKKENDAQPIFTQNITSFDFTASRAKIDSNKIRKKPIQKVETQQYQQKFHHQNYLEDTNSPCKLFQLNSPQIKNAQSNISIKRIQDHIHKPYHDHLFKGYDQNNVLLNKVQLDKLQQNHDSSIYMNPNSSGVLQMPTNQPSSLNKLVNYKPSSKSIKFPSQNTLYQDQIELIVDDNCLDDDQQFNSSILLSLEDNQEHTNQEENQENLNVKNCNFQNMNKNKQTSPHELNVNYGQKSVRESQLCSVDKKGLYISKIQRQNHVTNHNMTESVHLNIIKKIKFGKNTEIEDQEKQILNLLICDDTAFNITVLQKLLQNNTKYKMSIDTCLSGEEAIEKFITKNKPNSQNPYNYIFLDWNMPIMDGYETSLKIKFYVKDEQYLDCPIIICTAYEDTTEINKCLRNGTDAILTKPIRQDQLNELLENFQTNNDYYKKI